MRTTKPKRNVAGFVDAGGQFHPLRSPEYIGKRKATPKDRRKYSKALGGDLGIEKQKAALAEKWEDPWDKEAREEREHKERIEREIAGDIYGSRSERRSLLQFVRDSGGVKRQFRFGGKKAFGKRSEWDKGEIDRLSYKETGKRGLTSERGGKTLDKMYQSAREAGYDVGSIDDLLARVEDEAAGRGTTYATMGSLAYNPKSKKKNPGIADMAALANAVFTTMQIHDHMTRKAPKKRTTKAKGRRRNPVVSGQTAVGRKASPVKKAAHRSQPTANPRKRVTVPSKGRFYLMTIGSGDDTLGVFINDRDGDGISKKFKTVAAAKAYATKNRLRLENPAKAPRKTNPIFAPAWIKKLIAPVRTASGSDRAKPAKANPTGRVARLYKSKTLGGWVIYLDGVPLYPNRAGIPTVYPTLAKARQVAKGHNATKTTVTKRNPMPTAASKVINPKVPFVSSEGFAESHAKFTKWLDGVNASLLKKELARNPKKAVATKKANPLPKSKTAIENRLRVLRRRIKRLEAKDRSIRGKLTTRERTLLNEGSREMAVLVRKQIKAGRIPGVRFANPTPKKTAPKRRTNPVKVPRSRLFENFQGRTTSSVRSLETSHHLGSDRLIQLGKLHEIKLVGMNPIKINPNRVVLCATPNGKLAIAGQRFAKKNPGMRSNEISFLGEIEHVVYETHKPHHGDRPNQLYIHELGELDGRRPKLFADNVGFPIIKGGGYTVRPEGIVN